MMNISRLEVKHRNSLVALPAISFFFYFSQPAREIASFAARAINLYDAYTGNNKLKQYMSKNGTWRNLSKRKYDKDIALLNNYPKDLLAVILEYNSHDNPHEYGLPGEYGVYMFLRDKPLETAPLGTNLIRFDFNGADITLDNVENFVQFYFSLLKLLPFQSSNAGYAYKRVSQSENKASPGVNRKIARYYGFDPGYEPVRRKMLDHVFSAHWLNAIDNGLVDRLGGYEYIAESLTQSHLTKFENGVAIRGSRMPPIGDVNKGATDIGCIPEIARLLEPLRTEVHALGEPEFDAQNWLARYDQMENRPWR